MVAGNGGRLEPTFVALFGRVPFTQKGNIIGHLLHVVNSKKAFANSTSNVSCCFADDRDVFCGE
jgi:hypothetical protein